MGFLKKAGSKFSTEMARSSSSKTPIISPSAASQATAASHNSTLASVRSIEERDDASPSVHSTDEGDVEVRMMATVADRAPVEAPTRQRASSTSSASSLKKAKAGEKLASSKQLKRCMSSKLPAMPLSPKSKLPISPKSKQAEKKKGLHRRSRSEGAKNEGKQGGVVKSPFELEVALKKDKNCKEEEKATTSEAAKPKAAANGEKKAEPSKVTSKFRNKAAHFAGRRRRSRSRNRGSIALRKRVEKKTSSLSIEDAYESSYHTLSDNAGSDSSDSGGSSYEESSYYSETSYGETETELEDSTMVTNASDFVSIGYNTSREGTLDNDQVHGLSNSISSDTERGSADEGVEVGSNSFESYSTSGKTKDEEDFTLAQIERELEDGNEGDNEDDNTKDGSADGDNMSVDESKEPPVKKVSSSLVQFMKRMDEFTVKNPENQVTIHVSEHGNVEKLNLQVRRETSVTVLLGTYLMH